MDALLVYKEIQQQRSILSFGLLVSDIQVLAKEFSNLINFFLKRCTNRATHSLARHAVSLSYCMEWSTTPNLEIRVYGSFTSRHNNDTNMIKLNTDPTH